MKHRIARWLGLLLLGGFLALQAQELSPDLLKQLQGGKAQALLDSLRRLQQAPPTPQYLPLVPETVRVPQKPEYSTIEQAFRTDTLIPVSRDLQQFGYDLFEQASEMLQALSQSEVLPPVSSTYRLGPGDQITVHVWGKIDESFTFTVDPSGVIVLPKVGPVNVWGLTFAEATRLIRQRLGEAFSGVDFSVSLSGLRKVRVYVVGEVERPGTYTLSPVSNVLDPLILAGGVKKTGSLRRIRLLRQNADSARTLDLYRLLIHGKPPKVLHLEDGDILFVPTIGPVVAVAGAVRRPAIYELRGASTLWEVLQYAGGLSFRSDAHRIQIQRTEDHQRRVVTEITLPAPLSSRELRARTRRVRVQDGDLVIVQPVPAEPRRFVAVLGNVFRPGAYPWHPGMTLLEALQAAAGWKPGSYLDHVEILRQQEDGFPQVLFASVTRALQDSSQDLLLAEWDTVRVYAMQDLRAPDSVWVQGAVYQPGAYPYLPNLRAADLLFRAGGAKPYAALEHVEVYRIDPGEGARTVVLNLTTEADRRYPLRPGDRLLVPRHRAWQPEQEVIITGEVRYPGHYPFVPGQTLRDLIERAGGPTEHAYLAGLELYRFSTARQFQGFRKQAEGALYEDLLWQQMGLQQSELTKEEKEFQEAYLRQKRQEIVALAAQVLPETLDTYLLKPQEAETLKVHLVLPAERRRVGFSMVDTAGLSLPLEPGDSVHIPLRPTTVQVLGAVYYPGAFAYVPGYHLEDYLRLAGGPRVGADRKHLYVVKASGAVARDPQDVEPGDIVYVPWRPYARTPIRVILRDFASIVYQAALAIVAVYSIMATR